MKNLKEWIESYTNVTMPDYGGFKDLPLDTGGYYDVDLKKYFLNKKLFDRGLIDTGINELCKTMIHESFHPDDNLWDKFLLGISQKIHQKSYDDRAEHIIKDALKKDGVPPLPAPHPYQQERGR